MAFWDQASAGRIKLTGSVAGRISVGRPDGCVSSDADANRKLFASLDPLLAGAASAAGIDLAGATPVYLLPKSIMCSEQAPKGSTTNKRILLYGDKCGDARVSAHEYGHVLGVDHASALLPTGRVGDVGDGTDVMGSGLFPPNGPHRAQLGWIPAAKAVAVSASGTFRVAPLGHDAAGDPQMLVVTGTADPAKAIYISYRSAVGPDLGLSADYAGRASIHEFVTTCPTRTNSAKTLLLAAIADGAEHRIDGSGVTIRQVSHDQSGALVAVSISEVPPN